MCDWGLDRRLAAVRGPAHQSCWTVPRRALHAPPLVGSWDHLLCLCLCCCLCCCCFCNLLDKALRGLTGEVSGESILRTRGTQWCGKWSYQRIKDASTAQGRDSQKETGAEPRAAVRSAVPHIFRTTRNQKGTALIRCIAPLQTCREGIIYHALKPELLGAQSHKLERYHSKVATSG